MSTPSDAEAVVRPGGHAPLLAPGSRRLEVVHRAFYAFVGANGLFVATLGLVLPKTMARTFTWLVLPPLHARFVGVLYLFGAIYLFCCTITRRSSHADTALITIFIFTGILGVLTFLNLKAFDFGTVPAWVWTSAYVLFPVGSLALAWLARRQPRLPATEGPQLLAWARSLLLVQAAAFGLAGVLLLVARTVMVDAWPWKVTNVLAQSYSCAFLAYAWCSMRYALRNRAADRFVFLPAMFVLTGGTLTVSLKYRHLFSASDASTWVWFGAFGALFLGLVAVGSAMTPARTQRRPATR